MSTLAVNNIVRGENAKSIFESAKAVISSAVTCNQGDLIAFDTSAKILKAVTATSDAANILGVACQTLVSGKVKSPYSGTAVDASQALEDVKGPVYSVVAKLSLLSGDTFHPGDKVYLAATDAQTVTVTDPGDHNHVGIFQGAQVTAGSGSTGEVLVGARYGMASLSL